MALPLPKLDKLRYDELVVAARDLLPYRAPQWTDYNAHDPGTTLLELFAWLAECNSYRLDRLSPATERAFLRLIGCAPQRAATALAVVLLQPKQASGAVLLPARTQIASDDYSVRFQTSTSLRLVNTRLTKVLVWSKRGWTDCTAANAALDSTFLPFGEMPEEGDAIYLGFDAALAPVGERIGLFVFGANLSSDYSTWRRLREEYRLELRSHREPYRRRTGRPTVLWAHYSVTVAWEFFDGIKWRPLDRVHDVTRALSLSGPVRFLAPGNSLHRKGGVTGESALWFIRCRIVKGRYDCPPSIRAFRLNAIVARHAADNDRARLGRSTGRAGQRFHFSDQHAAPGSTRLEMANSPTPRWQERPDFDRSGPFARDYIIDGADGADAVLGDGRHGFVPPAGAVLWMSWQTGSGSDGNVPPKTLVALPKLGIASTIANWTSISAGIRVEQPTAAVGGADEEAIAAAEARAVRLLDESRCAITLEDFERLARTVPGVPVARARAVARFHPRYSCLPAFGCVTVVVITPCVRRAPVPTDALCRAVQRYLDARRPVATEVHVAGPEWTRVGVHARLRLRAGVSATAARAEAIRRIDAFLDPLSGGPDGTGWPIGRSVFRSETYGVLHDVAGVASVEELAFKRDDDPLDLCNNVAMCPHGMPLPGMHDIATTFESAP